MITRIALILALSCAAPAQEHKVGITYYIAPVYPPIARQARVQGDVIIQIKLSETGLVQGMTVLSGHPMLNGAALASLEKWQFICLDCKRTEPFTHRFTMTFVMVDLADPCKQPEVRKATQDFPGRMIVEQSEYCIESDPDGLPRHAWSRWFQKLKRLFAGSKI